MRRGASTTLKRVRVASCLFIGASQGSSNPNDTNARRSSLHLSLNIASYGHNSCVQLKGNPRQRVGYGRRRPEYTEA